MAIRSRSVCTLTLALHLLTPAVASADKLEDLDLTLQTQQKAIELQQSQMRQMQEELNKLRQERAAQQEEVTKRLVEAEKKADEAAKLPINAGYKDGFFLKSEDDRFRINLTGYLQSWFILEAGDRQQQNTFRVRRSRLNINGTFFKDFGYFFEAEFGGTARLEESWASYKRFPEATLIVGQHKPRYSLDNLTSSRDLDFAERAIIVRALAPDQQLGVTLEGRLFDNRLYYGVGLYNGCGRLDQCPGGIDTDNSKEATGRLAITPIPQLTLAADIDFRTFKRGPSGGFPTDGHGATVNNVFNPTTETGFRLAGAGFPINGNRVAASGDFVLDLYPFQFKGEYHNAWQERLGSGAGGTNLPDLRIQGLYGQVGYWIFGKKPEGLLALARYEYFRADADALKTGELPANVNAGLLGLNWYINRHVRLRANYIATDIDPDKNTNRRGGGGGIAHEGIAEVQVGF
jgi:phosphate-selective porin OprO/OprP